MDSIALTKGPLICSLSYLGDGVAYQMTYNRETQEDSSVPVYRDNKQEALKFIVLEASRMLKEGWEIAHAD